MRTVKVFFISIICVALLGACGLKGPLYLEDENPSAKPAGEQSQQKEADKEEDETGKGGARPDSV